MVTSRAKHSSLMLRDVGEDNEIKIGSTSHVSLTSANLAEAINALIESKYKNIRLDLSLLFELRNEFRNEIIVFFIFFE